MVSFFAITATLEDRLPPWLKGQARGWITAEYGMLPRATLERTRREASAGKQNGRNASLKFVNYMGFFIEGMQGSDVVGRITPVGGVLDHNAGPAPASMFPRVIRLVQ